MRNIFKSKKGSPTLEYVLIIAAGAAFAALLIGVFSKDSESGKTIKDEITKKVTETIQGVTENKSQQNPEN
ncbi:MAG: hypothetical protein WB502_06530 [Thermoactinomyces sp.]